MATYVLLANWTDQGVKSLHDTIDRADAFENLVEKFGGHVKALHWTIGPYDVVCTLEAPDDETMAAIAYSVSSLGNIRTTTLRGFDRREAAEILKRVP